jgi:hypothetical protein
MVVLLYVETCRVQSSNKATNSYSHERLLHFSYYNFFLSFFDNETVEYNKPRSLFSKFHHFSYLRNSFLQKMQMAFLPDSVANKAMHVF